MDQRTSNNIFSEILNPQEPPQEYAIPVAKSFEAIPPAIGSLAASWLSVGRTWSRSNIAAWAAAADATRVSISLAIALILTTASSLLTGIATLATNGKGALFGTPHNVMVSAIASILLSPLAFIGGVFFMAFVLTFLMHPSLGSRQTKFQRVLAPLALAFVPVGFASLIHAVIQSVITFLSPATNGIQVSLTYGASQCINGIVALAALGYSLALLIQSGSVGSSLTRIVVGAVFIVTVIVAGGLFSLLIFGIGFL